jgi:hypothetical protein
MCSTISQFVWVTFTLNIKNNNLNYFISDVGTHFQNMHNIHVTKMFMKSTNLIYSFENQ